MGYTNKVERFKADFKEFVEKKELTTEDYMKMFVTVWAVTKQGDGLTFIDIEKMITQELQ